MAKLYDASGTEVGEAQKCEKGSTAKMSEYFIHNVSRVYVQGKTFVKTSRVGLVNAYPDLHGELFSGKGDMLPLTCVVTSDGGVYCQKPKIQTDIFTSTKKVKDAKRAAEIKVGRVEFGDGVAAAYDESGAKRGEVREAAEFEARALCGVFFAMDITPKDGGGGPSGRRASAGRGGGGKLLVSLLRIVSRLLKKR